MCSYTIRQITLLDHKHKFYWLCPQPTQDQDGVKVPTMAFT